MAGLPDQAAGRHGTGNLIPMAGVIWTLLRWTRPLGPRADRAMPESVHAKGPGQRPDLQAKHWREGALEECHVLSDTFSRAAQRGRGKRDAVPLFV